MRQLAQIDILRHGHFRDQMKFLINNRYASIQRSGSIRECHLLAINLQMPGGWNVITAENF